MNKMLLAGSTGIVLLSAAASPVWADDNASTFHLDTPSPILITPGRCVGYGWQTTMKCHRTGG